VTRLRDLPSAPVVFMRRVVAFNLQLGEIRAREKSRAERACSTDAAAPSLNGIAEKTPASPLPLLLRAPSFRDVRTSYLWLSNARAADARSRSSSRRSRRPPLRPAPLFVVRGGRPASPVPPPPRFSARCHRVRICSCLRYYLSCCCRANRRSRHAPPHWPGSRASSDSTTRCALLPKPVSNSTTRGRQPDSSSPRLSQPRPRRFQSFHQACRYVRANNDLFHGRCSSSRSTLIAARRFRRPVLFSQRSTLRLHLEDDFVAAGQIL